MARFDFCSNCRSRASKEHHNGDMQFYCACGKQGLCASCANVSTCSVCGNGCCQDCSIPLTCCGRVLCGSGTESQQLCSANHTKTMTTRPCGHQGCVFSTDCIVCNPSSELEVAKPHEAASTTNRKKRSLKKLSIMAKQPSQGTATSKQIAPLVTDTREQVIQEPRAKRAVRSVYKKTTPATQLEPSAQNKPSFPYILFRMVTETARVSSDVIDWVENGEAFVVREPYSSKLALVLQDYFHHKKYSSLQRQLNMYGFKKHQGGRFKGAFHHPSFHRDRPDDLVQIRRRPPPARQAVAAARAATSIPAIPPSTVTASSTQNAAKTAPVVKTHVAPTNEPQVLSPNKKLRVHKKRSILRKHLPPKKRQIFPQDVENMPAPSPILSEVKQKFKSVAGKRPTLFWST